jgi:hypothetical protein
MPPPSLSCPVSPSLPCPSSPPSALPPPRFRQKKRTFFCTFRNNIIPLHRLFAVDYGKKTAKGRQKDGIKCR